MRNQMDLKIEDFEGIGKEYIPRKFKKKKKAIRFYRKMRNEKLSQSLMLNKG
jgi:hypothetical protein